MAVKRIVTEKQAEILTYKAASISFDFLDAGQERIKKQAVMAAMKQKINQRNNP